MIYRVGGKRLRIGGKTARSPNCCCPGNKCCAGTPYELNSTTIPGSVAVDLDTAYPVDGIGFGTAGCAVPSGTANAAKSAIPAPGQQIVNSGQPCGYGVGGLCWEVRDSGGDVVEDCYIAIGYYCTATEILPGYTVPAGHWAIELGTFSGYPVPLFGLFTKAGPSPLGNYADLFTNGTPPLNVIVS